MELTAHFCQLYLLFLQVLIVFEIVCQLYCLRHCRWIHLIFVILSQRPISHISAFRWSIFALREFLILSLIAIGGAHALGQHLPSKSGTTTSTSMELELFEGSGLAGNGSGQRKGFCRGRVLSLDTIFHGWLRLDSLSQH